MTTIVATHAVGNFNTWISNKNRAKLLPKICSSYRVFKHVDSDRVCIVFEGADPEKMKAFLSTPEVQAAEKEDTVLPPIDVYVEVAGGK